MTAFAAYTLEALDRDTACVERIVRMGFGFREPVNDAALPRHVRGLLDFLIDAELRRALEA